MRSTASRAPMGVPVWPPPAGGAGICDTTSLGREFPPRRLHPHSRSRPVRLRQGGRFAPQRRTASEAVGIAMDATKNQRVSRAKVKSVATGATINVDSSMGASVEMDNTCLRRARSSLQRPMSRAAARSWKAGRMPLCSLPLLRGARRVRHAAGQGRPRAAEATRSRCGSRGGQRNLSRHRRNSSGPIRR